MPRHDKLLRDMEGREGGREIEEGKEIWQSGVVSYPHLASLSVSLLLPLPLS